MKVNDLMQALNELKKKAPHFDFTQFNLTIDDKEVHKLDLDMEKITIRLLTEEVKSVEGEEIDLED